jgi:hypothetical protein
MWVVVLGSKGEVADAIRHAQAAAKVECGRKLRMLRTDNGGEFTAAEFTSYCMDEGVQCNLHHIAHNRMTSSSGATRRLWEWLEPSSSRGECLLSSGERWW